jgi:methylated-DNA-[protein]-cysteine S-methyltransferase
MLYYSHFDSQLGRVTLTASHSQGGAGASMALSGLYFEGQKDYPKFFDQAIEDDTLAVFASTRDQYRAYEAGRLEQFTVPLALVGTPFEQRVWAQLLTVPYGQTISYSTLAMRIGAPRAARAVGAAVGRNPVSVIVPCHRIVGAKGALTGYAGGLERKRWLLAREKAEAVATLG